MSNMSIEMSGSFAAPRTNYFTSTNSNLTRSLVSCAEAPTHVTIVRVTESISHYEEATLFTEIDSIASNWNVSAILCSDGEGRFGCATCIGSGT